MRKMVKITLAALALAAGLATSMPTVALQTADLTQTQREYQNTLGERQALIERLNTLEDQYERLVGEIDRVKSRGGMSTIAGRIELQNLLTRSKSISDELDALQSRLRKLDGRLDGQRTTLVSGIDQRLKELERSLPSANASRRAAIVKELNTLRRRRSGFAEPLPSGPSPGEVRDALELAEEAGDHPDDLMAAADELQDTEDQLRKRLAAIEGKLEELREARTLRRRARSFSREERFFEETDRDRVIARYDRETRTANRADRGGAEEDGQSEPTVGVGANNGSSADDDGNFAGAPGEEMAPTHDGDAAADRGGVPVTDAAGEAPVAEPNGPQDVFTTTRETIVIGGGSDPGRAVGAVGVATDDLDGEIRSLETEQQRLERQARKLRKRAEQLRRQARSE